MKLIVVEDRNDVFAWLKDHLKSNFAELFDTIDQIRTTEKARKIIEKEADTIIFCRLELPAENGLELLKWNYQNKNSSVFVLYGQNQSPEIIRSFMRLRCFDYLTEPQSENDWSVSIADMKAEINRWQMLEQDYKLGKALRQQWMALRAQTIRGFIAGNRNTEDMKSMASIGMVPELDGDGYLALIHIIRWLPGSERWERQFQAATFNCLMTEIFEPFSELVPIAAISDDTFLLMMQNQKGNEMFPDEIIRQLEIFNASCEQFYHLSIAIYLTDRIQIHQIPSLWPQLLDMRDGNVTRKSGIFLNSISRTAKEYRRFTVPKIEHWRFLIRDGYTEKAKLLALETLEAMTKKGEINRESLLVFYQDYMQVLYAALGDISWSITDIFQDPKSLEIYRNGMKSVDDMNELICYVSEKLKKLQPEGNTVSVVDRLCEYIDTHLDHKLSREDLAELVHLNPDYLTHLMKKETGMSIKSYVIKRKMETAQQMLRTTSMPISQIAYAMGFNNFSHFSQVYRKTLGISPTEERGKEV